MIKIVLALVFMLAVQCQNFNDAFDKIYDTSAWAAQGVPLSGPGSNPCIAIKYLIYLQHFIDRSDINKIVEIGFGDFEMNQHVILEQKKQYVGYDVAKSRIRKQQPNKRFILSHTLEDITERGDLLIIKDVIQHWPNREIAYLLKNILPGFRFAIITNDMANPDVKDRNDAEYGGYSRIPVNLVPNCELVVDFEENVYNKKTYLYTNPSPPK